MGLTGGTMLGLWIFYSVVCLIIYWKSIVLIFDFAGTFFQGLVFSAIAGIALMGLTMYFWKIAVVIVLLIGIALAIKSVSNVGRLLAIVLAVVLSIVIGVIGSNAKADPRYNKSVSLSYSDIAIESINI